VVVDDELWCVVVVKGFVVNVSFAAGWCVGVGSWEVEGFGGLVVARDFFEMSLKDGGELEWTVDVVSGCVAKLLGGSARLRGEEIVDGI
jgi:hypothetical protein